jgi:Predicted endonuclease containing a URI domain
MLFRMERSEYCVYILYSATKAKTYVGVTQNLIARFKSHNALGTKGYTRNYRPWIVVYVEFYSEKKRALKREKALKSGQGREWIKNFVLQQYQ